MSRACHSFTDLMQPNRTSDILQEALAAGTRLAFAGMVTCTSCLDSFCNLLGSLTVAALDCNSALAGCCCCLGNATAADCWGFSALVGGCSLVMPAESCGCETAGGCSECCGWTGCLSRSSSSASLACEASSAAEADWCTGCMGGGGISRSVPGGLVVEAELVAAASSHYGRAHVDEHTHMPPWQQAGSHCASSLCSPRQLNMHLKMCR